MVINPFTPSISQLRAFVAVADTLHFRDAAAIAQVSQAALSQALAALEKGLGTQLVERTTRRVLLTATGERLLPRARAVLEGVEAFRTEAVESRRPLVGRLRIGVIPTIAPYLLPSALRGMRHDAPELEPVVTEDQTERLIAALRAGRLDVAVLALPADEPGLAEIALYDEDFVLVVAADHPLAGRTDLDTRVLREAEPLLLLAEGHCLRDQALDICRSVGANPVDESTRATSLATVVQLVAGGLGTTLLPDTAVPVETRGGGIAIARFAAPAPGRRVGLLHRASSARAQEYSVLADILRRAARHDRLPVATETSGPT